MRPYLYQNMKKINVCIFFIQIMVKQRKRILVVVTRSLRTVSIHEMFLTAFKKGAYATMAVDFKPLALRHCRHNPDRNFLLLWVRKLSSLFTNIGDSNKLISWVWNNTRSCSNIQAGKSLYYIYTVDLKSLSNDHRPAIEKWSLNVVGPVELKTNEFYYEMNDLLLTSFAQIIL
jgi:hypothetical protein